jgi:hypothetical protein
VSLAVLFGIFVDEGINARSTESSSSDSLALLASPGPGCLAAAEGFDRTGDDGCLSGLLPFPFGLAFAIWAARAVAATPTVIVVTVVVAVTVVAAITVIAVA